MKKTLRESLSCIVADEYEYLNQAERDDLIRKTIKRLEYRISRGYRVCGTCKERKQPIDFSQDRRAVDGLASRCKKCERQRYMNRSA